MSTDEIEVVIWRQSSPHSSSVGPGYKNERFCGPSKFNDLFLSSNLEMWERTLNISSTPFAPTDNAHEYINLQKTHRLSSCGSTLRVVYPQTVPIQ